MSSVQHITCLIDMCNIGRRMPTRARQLAKAFAMLDEQDKPRVRLQMIERDVPTRMALRACQAAPSSLRGANRIVHALIAIFGKAEAIAILQEIGYDRRLFTCAERFSRPKKNRLKAAQQLCEHLVALFGPDPATSRLLAELQSKLNGTTSGTPQSIAVCP